MKNSAAILIVTGVLLAGCVGYEDSNRSPYRDSTAQRYNSDGTPYRYDRDHDGVSDRRDSDRDGDGVRNSQDQRPDDPRRY
jgi:hypothetical protein